MSTSRNTSREEIDQREEEKEIGEKEKRLGEKEKRLGEEITTSTASNNNATTTSATSTTTTSLEVPKIVASSIPSTREENKTVLTTSLNKPTMKSYLTNDLYKLKIMNSMKRSLSEADISGNNINGSINNKEKNFIDNNNVDHNNIDHNNLDNNASTKISKKLSVSKSSIKRSVSNESTLIESYYNSENDNEEKDNTKYIINNVDSNSSGDSNNGFNNNIDINNIYNTLSNNIVDSQVDSKIVTFTEPQIHSNLNNYNNADSLIILDDKKECFTDFISVPEDNILFVKSIISNILDKISIKSSNQFSQSTLELITKNINLPSKLKRRQVDDFTLTSNLPKNLKRMKPIASLSTQSLDDIFIVDNVTITISKSNCMVNNLLNVINVITSEITSIFNKLMIIACLISNSLGGLLYERNFSRKNVFSNSSSNIQISNVIYGNETIRSHLFKFVASHLDLILPCSIKIGYRNNLNEPYTWILTQFDEKDEYLIDVLSCTVKLYDLKYNYYPSIYFTPLLYELLPNVLDIDLINISSDLSEPIGSGVFSTVRSVVLKTSNIKHIDYEAITLVAALKTVKLVNEKDEKVYNDEQLNILLNELKMLIQLNHNNIVSLYGYYLETSKICILMEYCEHGTLLDLLVERKELRLNEPLINVNFYNLFTKTELIYIITNLLNCLNYFQDNKIVHRDISPQNILFGALQEESISLSSSGNLNSTNVGNRIKVKALRTSDILRDPVIEKSKLLSRSIKITDFNCSINFNSLLETKYPLGALRYTAPEILNNEFLIENTEVIPKLNFENYSFSDTYSLGLIIMQLMTGDYPYPSIQSENELLNVLKECNASKYYDSKLISKDLLPIWEIANKCVVYNYKKRISLSELKDLINNL